MALNCPMAAMLGVVLQDKTRRAHRLNAVSKIQACRRRVLMNREGLSANVNKQHQWGARTLTHRRKIVYTPLELTYDCKSRLKLGHPAGSPKFGKLGVCRVIRLNVED